MEFLEFRNRMQEHFAEVSKDQNQLFTVNVDKDKLWELYLDSFPEGTNQVYRERREFDCSCCRHFIKSFGAVVFIENNQPVSIWDFETGDSTYQPVIDALGTYVKSLPIGDVFVTKEARHGIDKNHEQLESKAVRTWHHFFIKLPKRMVSTSHKTEASIMGDLRSTKEVFQRSLAEISIDSVESVLDLISQRSLYKGEEWQSVLTRFANIQKEHAGLWGLERTNYCWSKSIEVGPVIGKIKNHSIGTLLINVSEGMDLDLAVKKYEAIVAPTNYKRPKAIFTKKMVEAAEKTVSDLGLLDSLSRRFAVIEDITINNVLFANKDSAKQMKGVFEDLKTDVSINTKSLSGVEEVSVDHFVSNILPRLTNMEVLFENKHESNLVSLIAPENIDAKSMFKWNNGFSWSYSGNITDSMKERVKAAGGNVGGVLRFSIQWNESGKNNDDYDAHCKEPNGNHIWYSNARRVHQSSGVLDIDIQYPKKDIAVENITWSDLNRMQSGVYQLYVHNFANRGGSDGFRAEIEYNGQIHSFDYPVGLKQDENILVAEIHFDRENGIRFIKSLDSSVSSREIWNLKTNQFQPVSTFMYSPNYWDDQSGIGNRHYMFMLKGCINETTPNGFFNEFLNQDLMEHKRVFEALGSKMKVENSENQLSGLGFSSTKRNSVVVKVDGHVSRTLKVMF